MQNRWTQGAQAAQAGTEAAATANEGAGRGVLSRLGRALGLGGKRPDET